MGKRGRVSYPGLGIIWEKMLLQVEQDENSKREFAVVTGVLKLSE